jgi:pimeloyl-ACP methyl ester carboxylesterase
MFLSAKHPVVRRAAVLGALVALAWLAAPGPGFAEPNPQAKAHLFVLLGFGDWSPGLREFGVKMQKRGIPTTVGSYTGWEALADQAGKEYWAGHPIIIVGHSAGGATGIAMAAKLGEDGIPVRLLVTLAPWTELKVSANVVQSVNIVPSGYENHFSVIWAHERELTAYVTKAAGLHAATEQSPALHAAQ